MLFFSACSSDERWAGKYSYFEEFPAETKEDSPLQWNYSLELKPAGENLSGTLGINGFEIKEHFKCRGQLSGNTLEVYAEESIANPSCSFRKNDLLFELIREDTNTITAWKKLKPRTPKRTERDSFGFKKD